MDTHRALGSALLVIGILLIIFGLMQIPLGLGQYSVDSMRTYTKIQQLEDSGFISSTEEKNEVMKILFIGEEQVSFNRAVVRLVFLVILGIALCGIALGVRNLDLNKGEELKEKI